MRLQKSDYIRLWYIAGLVQFEALEHAQEESGSICFQHNVIASEDKVIFDGLREVYSRFVKLFEPYEFVQPQNPQNKKKLEEFVQSQNPQNKKKPEKKKISDPQIERIFTLILVIEEKGEIKNSTVEERSFKLFKSISSAVDFYCKFLNILDLHEVISILKQHPDIPLGRWILQNLYFLFNLGYEYKIKNNYGYALLDCAVSELLNGLKKCLEKLEYVFTFESPQDNSKEREALEDYLKEMCELYCVCNRTQASALKDSEKENRRRAKISAKKKDNSKKEGRQEFWDKVINGVSELQKNNPNLSKASACKNYYYKHKDLFEEKGKDVRTLINRYCKVPDPNKRRAIFNAGTSIQATFNDQQLIQFGKEYAKWLKSQEVQQENRQGSAQGQDTQS